MRRRKLITTILATIMVFPFFFGLGNGKNVMAETENQVVVLHKRAFDNLPTPPIQNTGDVMDFAGEPVAGAVYTAYDVSEIYWATYDTTAGTDTAKSAAAEVVALAASTEGSVNFVFPETDSNGEATYVGGLPKKSMVEGKLRNAIYLFKETVSPAGVVQSQSVPFVLGLPVYDEGTDTEKEVVHIYPKNEIEELDLGFTKYGVDEEGRATVLQGAKFVLRTMDGDYFTTSAEGKGFNTTDIDEAQVFSSDENGIVSTGDLMLQPGQYAFEEIDSSVAVAATDYAESGTDYYYTKNPVVEIEIGSDMKVTYDWYDIKGSKVADGDKEELTPAVYNHMIPGITKEADKKDLDVNQTMAFTIEHVIAQNVADYDNYSLLDQFDERLELVSTKAELDAQLADFGGAVTVNDDNSFTVDFTRNKLIEKAGTKLTLVVEMAIKSDVTLDDLGEDLANTITFNNDIKDRNAKDSIKTFGKSFLKIDMDTEDALVGAKFYVKKDGLYLGTRDGKLAWEAPTSTTKEDGRYLFADGFTAKELTSSTEGEFSVVGLAQKDGAGDITYELEEFVAPDGYALLQTTIEFVADNGKVVLPVANKHKGSLPSTGGSGIVAFVLIGIVAVGGAVLYFTKGRRQING